MKRLPKKFKEEWIAALRSGEYKQGKNQLNNRHSDTYCCMGVACVVAGHKKTLMNNADSFIDLGKYKNVPSIIKGDPRNSVVNSLVSMNDGVYQQQKSFNQIADWIQINL